MRRLILVCLYALLITGSGVSGKGILDTQKLLNAETFWDNQDWDWYKDTIPFFECPDPDITTTYYYRWELITKHLTYGSPRTGYTFTEFIDRPFWSGTYGAISCPVGLQLYEVRWLRDDRYAKDYARYWFRTLGAQPRRYSTWLADAVWAIHCVHPDVQFAKNLLPDLVKNYQEWERGYYVPAVGLFWQTGHDDGMEFNINSRQTKDILRGAPGYRPTINAYMWADSIAIAKMAELIKDPKLAGTYQQKAARLKQNLQEKLWDPKRRFFFPMSRNDETAGGHTVKALSLTYQTGQFAGNPYGRELIGYVPWQFNMLDHGKGYEIAWKKLLSKDGFAATYGPTTVERKDPLFKISPTCCWWSGNSWPYATAQTLKGMANVLQNVKQEAITPADYLQVLTTFARTHRKNGKPYIAEACHPDTGSWEGHDGYNHSEHYFHSNFCDLVITGLVGVIPENRDTLRIHPLAPSTWDYFALDQLPYRGHLLTILWDRTGKRYGRGVGLRVMADGKEIGSQKTLGSLSIRLPDQKRITKRTQSVNYAVNNDGTYYPRAFASHTGSDSSVVKLIDGNFWYHRSPPNRWTAEGSKTPTDFCGVEFGTPRTINTVKLYVLDDGETIVAPDRIELEYWDGVKWKLVPSQERIPEKPTGHRPTIIQFPEVKTTKIRAVLIHRAKAKSGLSEFETWGPPMENLDPPPMPAGNLALNTSGKGFPRATASYSDRFGGKAMAAIDGKVSFLPNPFNRWTSYESPNEKDWLEIDMGAAKKIARVELGIYDDRGGVQAPVKYEIQSWSGTAWEPVTNAVKSPEKPAGGQFNEVRFLPVMTSKIRIVFTNKGRARSGVTEILVWSS